MSRCRHGCGFQESFTHAENRPFRVEAAKFESFAGFCPELLQERVQGSRCNHHTIVGNVVQERRGARKKERQVILDATVCNAIGNIPIDARFSGLAFEALAVAITKPVNRVRVEWHFAGRQNVDLVNLVARQLRRFREVAQRFDLIIEEIDTHRRIRSHRENIDQRSTDRKLAVFRDLGNPIISGGDQRIGEFLAMQGLPCR